MRLKIVRATGEETIHEITPSVEYAFELYAKKGFYRAFTDDPKMSDLYWIAWEVLRKSGTTVPTFGAAFLDTLAKVEVLGDEDSPNS